MITSYLTDVIAGLETRVAQLRELEAALAETGHPNIIILGMMFDDFHLPHGVELVTSGDVRVQIYWSGSRWTSWGARGARPDVHRPDTALHDAVAEAHDAGTAYAAVARAVEWLTVRADAARQATP